MLRKPFDGIYPITQKFGENPSYYSQFGFAGHEGVDWGTPNGTPILSCEKGKVVRRNDVKDGAYGIYCVVWHEELNLATWYCHLQEVKVKIGDYVDLGQVIALSDNTGNTSGPHLHLNLCETDSNGVRINQNNGYKGFIDPLPYFETGAATPCPESCQKIIDSLRGERDTNWNLYQDEKKAHAETLAMLKSCEAEKKKYQESIYGWANLLGVAGTTEAVDVAIHELMKKEDLLRKALADLDAKSKALKDAEDENQKLTALLEECKIARKKSEEDLTTCQTEKGEVYGELKACQANCVEPEGSCITKFINCLFSKGVKNVTTKTDK